MEISINKKHTRLAIGVFTLLNGIGYDDENRTKGMSPERLFVRRLILPNNWAKKYPKLSKLKKYNPYWVLFGFLSGKNESRISSEIHHEFRKFLKEPTVVQIIERLEPKIIFNIEKMIGQLRREYLEIQKMVNISPRVKKIFITESFIDAHWRGYLHVIKKDVFITIGPGSKRSFMDVFRHELFHLFAPYVNVEEKINFSNPKNKTLSKVGYKGKKILSEEYAVRGLSLLYEKRQKKDVRKKISEEEEAFPDLRRVIESLEKQIPH